MLRLAGFRIRELSGRCIPVAFSSKRYYSQELSKSVPASRVRNLGIIAHIDAGKTTTTERMLYYAGVTKRLGNVDSGDTVTDFLEAERERGITIQSAAITFDWNEHQINLIDTPGHADFNFEVVRSLRVLDGAITILDGVAGVEALTEKVWGLARELGIPRLIYINKMDRPGAGFSRTVREVVSKLQTRVGLLTVPVFENDKFVGIIDVLRQQRIIYQSEDGKKVEVVEVASTPQAKEAADARQALIDQLSDIDETVIEEFLETETVTTKTLIQALQRASIDNKLTPVLCGASFRNIGIQPLLDAAVQYLPSPEQLRTANGPKKNLVEMLAFKVRQDPQRGPLVYVRVYNGTLKKNATILNTTTQKTERISRLLRMQADEPVEISSVSAGDIAVLGGTTNISTGDTLIAHPSKLNGVSGLPKTDKQIKLLPIPVPPPVFMTRIGPKGPGDVRGMNAALEILLREDPSLHLRYDDETGQYLLSGMGELHLEIATDRLVNDLKARVDVGDVMITYKETLEHETNEVAKEQRDSYGSTTSVKVVVKPRSQDIDYELADQNKVSTTFRHPRIDKDDVTELCGVGITPILAKGGALGRYALFGLEFDIQVNISPDSDSTEFVSSLVRDAVNEALEDPANQFILLEPVMNVQISCSQAQVGTVSTDLSSTRRGLISAMSDSGNIEKSTMYTDIAQNMWLPLDHTMYMSKHGDQTAQPLQIHAQVPLRKMIGYLNSLRSMTQGRGTFEMSFKEFSDVPAQDISEILES